MGIIRKEQGATADLNYLVYFHEYAENIATINGVLKPFVSTMEIYGGKVNNMFDITTQCKVSYEVLVFNRLEEKQEYELNKKQKQNG